jgi:hypothetical protein
MAAKPTIDRGMFNAPVTFAGMTGARHGTDGRARLLPSRVFVRNPGSAGASSSQIRAREFATISILLALVICVGCDRTPPKVAAPATATAPAVVVPDLNYPLQCELSIVAPLLPKLKTHVAVDPASNIYFVQETDEGGDGMFVIGSGEVSVSTPLSSQNILGELGEKGTGNIQSIAAGGDGNIYFFFMGGSKRKTIACFGRYDPRTHLLRILANEARLESATGMGASLTLASGTVACAGPAVWLWIRHADVSCLFGMKFGQIPDEGLLSFPRTTSVRSRTGPIDMTRDDLQLAGGPGDSLLLVDTWTAALWKIEPNGNAEVLQSLVNLPMALGLPGANSRGEIAMFASQSDRIEPRVEGRVVPVDVDTRYPSLLLFRNGKVTGISWDDFVADNSFPRATMQFQQTFYEPGRDTWIGYDAATGQLLRLKLVPKRTR